MFMYLCFRLVVRIENNLSTPTGNASNHLYVQWDLDLTNYQGTKEMRSLYRGFVKSKTSIYEFCMKIIKIFVTSQ